MLLTTADKVLGKPRRKKQPWITNKILDLCDERRTLKKEKNNSPDAANSYRLTNSKIRKMAGR